MTLVQPKPGEIVFARTTGVLGRLIRLGERLRLKRGSEWNHAGIVSDEVDEQGRPLLIQATIKGVTGDKPVATVAPGGKYTVLSLPDGVDPLQVVAFAKSQIGQRYGLLTILAIASDIVTWNWVPAFEGSRKPSWICSALAGEALRCGGWIHTWVNSATVTPQQLFDALNH